ncbi:MAG: MFS transporter [Bacteroidota bacterium]
MKNTTALILLFIANSISGLAQGISMLAIPWYFARNGEMSKFGLIYVLTNIIALFWVPYSGTFIDRFNRKHIFLVICLVCGSLILSTAALGFWQEGLPWYLVAVVFMLTFFNYNVHYPNLYAFVQEITEAKYYGRITSYIEIQGQLTAMLAGAGAAFLLEGTSDGLIELFGGQWQLPFTLEAWTIYEIFLLDAGTYFAAFVIIYLIQYAPLTDRKLEKGNVWEQLQVGYRYLKQQPSVFLFGVASYSIFVTVLIEGFYLGALYVKEHLEAGGNVFATSEVFYAIGAVFSGLAIRRIFYRLSLPMSVIIMTIVTAILYAVLTFSASSTIFYLMLFILGITNAGTRIQRTTYLFANIPNQVYGRAASIFFLTNISFRIFFLSLFALPFFQTGHQVAYTFGILSLFLLISAVVLIRYYPAFRKTKATNEEIQLASPTNVSN